MKAISGDNFEAVWLQECKWCVLSPWLTTPDGRNYRLHCAENLTEEEAREIAAQLASYRPRDAPLSVRDLFAMSALQGLVTNNSVESGAQIRETVAYSYAIADAMLNERTKPTGER